MNQLEMKNKITRKRWTIEGDKLLQVLVKEGREMAEITAILGRTEPSIRFRCHSLDLKPSKYWRMSDPIIHIEPKSNTPIQHKLPIKVDIKAKNKRYLEVINRIEKLEGHLVKLHDDRNAIFKEMQNMNARIFNLRAALKDKTVNTNKKDLDTIKHHLNKPWYKRLFSKFM